MKRIWLMAALCVFLSGQAAAHPKYRIEVYPGQVTAVRSLDCINQVRIDTLETEVDTITTQVCRDSVFFKYQVSHQWHQAMVVKTRYPKFAYHQPAVGDSLRCFVKRLTKQIQRIDYVAE